MMRQYAKSSLWAKARWWMGASIAVTALCAAWNPDSGLAKGPPGGGGGGSAPTSEIYFTLNGNSSVNAAEYVMNDDGSGKTQVLPNEWLGVPSSQLYDGSRWWLTIVNPDTGNADGNLYAFRYDGTSIQSVELTDTAADGVHLMGQQWSNDGQDSFVAAVAAPGNATGSAPYNHSVVRLPIGASDIATLQVPLTAADLELVVEPEVVASVNSVPTLGGYGFSPNADILAYTRWNYDVDETGNATFVDATLWVRMLPTDPGGIPVDVPIYTGDASQPYWSPDGMQIAFDGEHAGLVGYNYGVATISPDGSGYALTDWHLNGHMRVRGWSPDSKELLIFLGGQKPVKGVSTFTYDIVRAPAGGGNATVLTGDLSATTDKYPLAWFPLIP